MTIDDLTLDTTQSIDIKADIGDVFRGVLHLLGEGFSKPPEGESIQMTLERPGGTHVDFRHRATSGWKNVLDRVGEDCSTRTHGQRS